MQVSIESATAGDGSAILRLLSNNALPLEGLLEHMDTVIVARADSRIVGCAALELYPDGALHHRKVEAFRNWLFSEMLIDAAGAPPPALPTAFYEDQRPRPKRARAKG